MMHFEVKVHLGDIILGLSDENGDSSEWDDS